MKGKHCSRHEALACVISKPAPPGGASARVWEGWGTHTAAMSASLQQITAQLPAHSDAERGSSSPPNSRHVQPLAVQACMGVGCAAQARLVVQALVGAQQLVQDGVAMQVGVVRLPQLAHHALRLQWFQRRRDDAARVLSAGTSRAPPGKQAGQGQGTRERGGPCKQRCCGAPAAGM